MTATLGTWMLVLAVLTGAGVMLASAASLRLGRPGLLNAARWLVGLFAALLTAASAALLYAMVNSDFSIAYVAGYTEKALPIGYKLAAFWAGQEGSVLLWAWILAVMAVVLVLIQRKHTGVEPAVTLLTLGAVCTFFVVLMLFADTHHCQYCEYSSISESSVYGHMADVHADRPAIAPRISSANPFRVHEPAPADGHGLNPLLQHPSMIAHPPLLFVGYAGFTIPFAMLFGALAARRTDNDWIMATRGWLIFSWLFLSVGILLGAQWAYVELGWGGYWAWDPVENASLLPWLTSTALLHSIAIQKSRGMFKRWNAALIIASFVLCIFGTWLTRSGVISSVHAFGQSLVGTFFLVFMLMCIATSIAVLGLSWRQLKPERPLESLLSKEAAFLYINGLLSLMTVTVLLGTIWPLISSLFRPEPVTPTEDFYNKVVAPMSMVLLALMALGPLLRLGSVGAAAMLRRLPVPGAMGLLGVIIAGVFGFRDMWTLASGAILGLAAGAIIVDLFGAVRARSAEFGEGPVAALVRLLDSNHRRYGGQLIHIGMLMMMLGIVGSSLFGVEQNLTLSPGQSAAVGPNTLKFNGLRERRGANFTAIEAHVELIDAAGVAATLHPQMRFYDKSERPHAEVALQSTLRRDVYVTLAGWEGNEVGLQTIVNPLVLWIWIGGVTLTFGGLVCLFPRLLPEPRTARFGAAARDADDWPASMQPTNAEASR